MKHQPVPCDPSVMNDLSWHIILNSDKAVLLKESGYTKMMGALHPERSGNLSEPQISFMPPMLISEVSRSVSQG